LRSATRCRLTRHAHAQQQASAVPRSFVLKRGRLAALVDELANDMRKARGAARHALARAAR
jgi:hypothetical protein